MERIKVGDIVQVITGNDLGKRGEVIKVIRKKQAALVEGLNVQKKHVKPTRQKQEGGIVEKPGPIHLSNLMPVCPHCDKPSRISFSQESGEKVRVCKKCGKEIKR